MRRDLAARQRHEAMGSLGCVLLTVCAAIVLWPMMSYFEAVAYEEETGREVSTWSAMFLDLRVQAEPGQ